MTLVETLALLNACLNGTAGVLMSAAWVAIKRKKVSVHRPLMVSAFVVSCLFLASYVTRFALSGDTKFGGEGAIRTVYFVLLISHVLLAVAVPPLAIRTLYLAVKKRFDAHRRIARVTFPIWLYVSVTGVLVYLMLYEWFPRGD